MIKKFREKVTTKYFVEKIVRQQLQQYFRLYMKHKEIKGGVFGNVYKAQK